MSKGKQRFLLGIWVPTAIGLLIELTTTVDPTRLQAQVQVCVFFYFAFLFVSGISAFCWGFFD